jgi:hypothetical protein
LLPSIGGYPRASAVQRFFGWFGHIAVDEPFGFRSTSVIGAVTGLGKDRARAIFRDWRKAYTSADDNNRIGFIVPVQVCAVEFPQRAPYQ